MAADLIRSLTCKELNINGGQIFTDAVNNRIGFGTKTPGSFFHTVTDGGPNIFRIDTSRNSTSGPFLFGRFSRGSVDTPLIVQDNDATLKIIAVAHDGVDFNTESAGIVFEVDGTPGANDVPGRIVFSTTADGAQVRTDRMTIKADGNVDIVALLGGAVNLTADASGNIIRDPSDEKFKENVKPITGALEKVKQLQGITHKWKPEINMGLNEEYGFIAQQVKEIIPELVSGGETLNKTRQIPIPNTDEMQTENYTEESYLAVKYGKMVAVLVEAIKELDAKITALQ